MQIPRTSYRSLLWTVSALGLLLAWDASGLDMPLAHMLGNAHGFPLQNDWFLSSVMHEGARRVAWIPALWLLVGIFKPTGVQRRLAPWQRVQWAGTTFLALAAISLLKHLSHTSCPWDLAEFGGHANWVSHWALGVLDDGPGRCFPAGHASAAFAFVSGYFVLRRVAPVQALAWLVGALALGLALGATQQLRGAHFMSHTLWTGWLCWTIAWLVDTAALSRHADEPSAPAEPEPLAP